MDGFLSQILSVLLVLLLLGGLLWASRRRGVLWLKPHGTRGAGPDVVVLARRVLTSQHTLFLVEIRGRSLLIATSPGNCHVLERFDAGDSGGFHRDS
jgi:flagellar biogenesis protein FliO